MLGLKSLKSSTRSSILTLLALAPGMLGQTPDVPTKSGAHVETDGIPRLPNGRPDLNGIWDHPYVPDVARSTKNGVMSQEGPGSLPYLPAALEEFKKYDPSVDGDYTGSCLPFGYFRSFNAPYPIQILQTQEYVGFLFEQNNWFHTVTMGKKHPDPDHLNPTWFGDSVGSWDGDTLVIDTIGFNGKTRLDTIGHQHSDAMHIVQRVQRLDAKRLQMEFIVEDPKVYSEPWKNKRVFALMKPGQELMEYSCEENNRDFTQGHIKLPAK
jgi:hypothetical protein